MWTFVAIIVSFIPTFDQHSFTAEAQRTLRTDCFLTAEDTEDAESCSQQNLRAAFSGRTNLFCCCSSTKLQYPNLPAASNSISVYDKC
jgi:hypothetical protein